MLEADIAHVLNKTHAMIMKSVHINVTRLILKSSDEIQQVIS